MFEREKMGDVEMGAESPAFPTTGQKMPYGGAQSRRFWLLSLLDDDLDAPKKPEYPGRQQAVQVVQDTMEEAPSVPPTAEQQRRQSDSTKTLKHLADSLSNNPEMSAELPMMTQLLIG